MLRAAYADTSVAALVRDRFVPIWVDADQRPDISERYSLGGWPTTAFLTPDGRLLGGETYATVERLAELLPTVADAFARQYDALSEDADGGASDSHVGNGAHRDAGGGHSPSGAEGPDPSLDGWVATHLLEQFDAEHGGFGTGAKRIHSDALELARQYVAAGDSAFVPVVERTLRAIAWGGLYDHRDGGVFRFCARRDWTDPSTEKLLPINAAALRLFLDSHQHEADEWHERAVDLLRFVRRTFVPQDDDRAGFSASQRADATYYTTDVDGTGGPPPPVDATVYADGTALMARAYVRAAGVLEDDSLLAFAADAVERVVADTYERGAGIAHEADTTFGMRGLLTDQVRASAALVDLHVVTERDVYLDMAQELMHFALHRLWDRDAGGFRDRIHADDDIGLLREPLRPYRLNCEAARVLARLASLAEAPVFLERALRTLASQSAVVRAHGVDAAAYVIAMRELG